MIRIFISFQKDAEIMRKTTVSQSFALLEDKHHIILEDKHLQVNTCFDLEGKKSLIRTKQPKNPLRPPLRPITFIGQWPGHMARKTELEIGFGTFPTGKRQYTNSSKKQ